MTVAEDNTKTGPLDAKNLRNLFAYSAGSGGVRKMQLLYDCFPRLELFVDTYNLIYSRTLSQPVGNPSFSANPPQSHLVESLTAC